MHRIVMLIVGFVFLQSNVFAQTLDRIPFPDQTVNIITVADDTSLFIDPIVSESPFLNGRSLSEIIQGSPVIAPIEGLPEEYWKGKKCFECHNWNINELCGQGRVYGFVPADRRSFTGHPFNGDFREYLFRWAEAGCQ